MQETEYQDEDNLPIPEDDEDWDLAQVYDFNDPFPEELQPYEGPPITLENSSVYGIDEDGLLYFYCGHRRIKVTEHFPETGRTIGELMEDLILHEAKKQENFNDLNC